MALSIWIENLIAYCLQIAVLAAAGTLLAYIFRLRAPRISLLYWQVLLLACLFIPLLQNWKHPAITPAIGTSGAAQPVFPNIPAAAESNPAFSATPEAVFLVLAAGAVLRILWMALGFLRLRILLRRSVLIAGMPSEAGKICSRIKTRARFHFSDEIDSPATFGIISPTVILPRSFFEMSESCREAVVCHELVHVRRRDWALILVEEIVRSLYWFHPAVWWLLGRIHLAREQSVDHEAVRLTGSRQQYLDSLLEIARAHGSPKAIPAPLFLRERHLVQRVALLLKEVPMNRLRTAVSLIGMAILLAGTVHLAAAWFPLTGAPVTGQDQSTDSGIAAPLRDPIRVGGNVQNSKLIYRVDPVYPEEAMANDISGIVILVITVNELGLVWDVKALNGHPLLAEAAIAAVKRWRYSPTLLNGVPVPVSATVRIEFAAGEQGETISLRPAASLPAATIQNQWGLFYMCGPGTPIVPPELDFDGKLLSAMAASQWPSGGEEALLAYMVFINEESEVAGVQRIRGPEIPEVENELMRMRVARPGFIGSNPVPVYIAIEIMPAFTGNE